MKQRLENSKLIVGIDEAGRGPLAGPVSVAAFCAPAGSRVNLMKILGGKIRDSKHLSPKRRTAIYRNMWALRKTGEVNFMVCHVSNKIVDKIRISKAVQVGINRSLNKLRQLYDRNNIVHCSVRLDGLLKAPEEYKKQKTIIKGDEKDLFIAYASIVAKVRRDRLMCRLSKKYPKYKFEIHKGYGTPFHRKLIKKHGFSSLHRISFCDNV